MKLPNEKLIKLFFFFVTVGLFAYDGSNAERRVVVEEYSSQSPEIHLFMFLFLRSIYLSCGISVYDCVVVVFSKDEN